MSVLTDLNAILEPLGIPIETGVFTDKASNEYMVVIPLSDTFGFHADNTPAFDVQEARISIYSKGNYNALKNNVVRTLLNGDFTITSRQYIGYETETDYHHYNVDVAKQYEMEE